MSLHLKFEPSLLLIAILCYSIEISFIRSTIGNLFLIFIGFIYLLFNNINYLKLNKILLISIPIAFGTWTSFWLFGTKNNLINANIYTTRLYTYLLLGNVITLTTTPRELLMNLHIRFKLSNTFVYGILASLNLLNQVKQQLKIIKYAAKLRGINYHIWSPQLYFKAILNSYYWADDLSNAMHSHGFSEGYPRTEANLTPWPYHQILILILIFIFFNYIIFFL